ncbi:DUF6807 domain-containing protein [Aureliella helgolandensis]|uniref:Methane oxygenase PmoA n=1 Tax=Aureliella helgolandensis TaxID=2527968 RepID=A0A518G6Z6_9BACT|nr:PmoA family protein [Aureliella helgolandensis]QDV24355.1 hypothetical protein Q31a_26720 [Aureliella helgolandensis]
MHFRIVPERSLVACPGKNWPCESTFDAFRLFWCTCLSILTLMVCAQPVAAQFRLEKHAEGVRVFNDGTLVADYLTKSMSKPIIWPLVGPTGKQMTRAYPMVADSENEKHDHPHHRSLWFTHGDVNGTDFWLEGGEGGITEHLEFTQLEDGEQAVLATRNLWKTAAGEPVLSDHRRFTFGGDNHARWLDCEIVLTATHGPVNFGDTKEGTFGLRIAESMKVDHEDGGKIINSHGDEDSKAWGVAAEWVDYVGPVDGETLGIAIFCHPSTFHFPNRWHVRTYGLFAANPFGVHHFLNQKDPTAGVDLPAGEKLLFRYRVLLHTGNTEEAKVAELYGDYAKTEFPDLD